MRNNNSIVNYFRKMLRFSLNNLNSNSIISIKNLRNQFHVFDDFPSDQALWFDLTKINAYKSTYYQRYLRKIAKKSGKSEIQRWPHKKAEK